MGRGHNFFGGAEDRWDRRRTRFVCDCREVRDEDNHHGCGCHKCNEKRERELVCRCREVSR